MNESGPDDATLAYDKFYPRNAMHSVVHTVVCPSVGPPVCPSPSDIVLKSELNVC